MPKYQSTDSIASVSSTANTDSSSPKEQFKPIIIVPYPPSYHQTVINNISSVLFNIVYYNKTHKIYSEENDILYSKHIPKLSIEEFLIRVVKYSKIELSTLVYMYIYTMRLITRNDLILRYNNVYRVLLGACVISVKFNEDTKFPYKYYSKIGGMTVEELSAVEFSLFTKLNCELFINEDEYYETLGFLLQI